MRCSELPAKLGYEAAGVVTAVGPDVDRNWIGKKASTVPAFLMTKYGVYGEVAIVPAYALAVYPQKLSPEEGTSIWMQYLTAYGALITHGQIGIGDFLIITAASSSVGIAASEMVNTEGGRRHQYRNHANFQEESRAGGRGRYACDRDRGRRFPRGQMKLPA